MDRLKKAAVLIKFFLQWLQVYFDRYIVSVNRGSNAQVIAVKIGNCRFSCHVSFAIIIIFPFSA